MIRVDNIPAILARMPPRLRTNIEANIKQVDDIHRQQPERPPGTTYAATINHFAQPQVVSLEPDERAGLLRFYQQAAGSVDLVGEYPTWNQAHVAGRVAQLRRVHKMQLDAPGNDRQRKLLAEISEPLLDGLWHLVPLGAHGSVMASELSILVMGSDQWIDEKMSTIAWAIIVAQFNALSNTGSDLIDHAWGFGSCIGWSDYAGFVTETYVDPARIDALVARANDYFEPWEVTFTKLPIAQASWNSDVTPIVAFASGAMHVRMAARWLTRHFGLTGDDDQDPYDHTKRIQVFSEAEMFGK